MDVNEPVPEADNMERELGHDDEASDEVAETPDLGDIAIDKPEADVIEQELPVDVERARVAKARPDDVPEADWIEQSIVEPVDDDMR